MDNKRKRGTGRIGGVPVTGIESFMNKSASSKPEAKKIQKKPYRREVDLDICLEKLKQNVIPVCKQVGWVSKRERKWLFLVGWLV